MTDHPFWKTWWAVIFSGGPILMAIIAIIHTLYITRHLTALLKAMENSKVIAMFGGASEPKDIAGRFLLVGQIAVFAVWPKIAMKGGFVSKKDIDNFPPTLLNILKMNMTLLIITLIWTAIFYTTLKFKLIS